jgi:hypothetical protein
LLGVAKSQSEANPLALIQTQVRGDLITMWEKLGLVEAVRGRLWEELQMAMKAEAEGLPVDMELLARCRDEVKRLQTVRCARPAGNPAACAPRAEERNRVRARVRW